MTLLHRDTPGYEQGNTIQRICDELCGAYGARIGVTGALTYEHPYSFARRASTLDHLTKGRFGWNIVSGEGDKLHCADEPAMVEQSSTGRTYTRDAYAPVRRDARAEVKKINGGLHTSAFPFL
jgi:hypothetical protein